MLRSRTGYNPKHMRSGAIQLRMMSTTRGWQISLILAICAVALVSADVTKESTCCTQVSTSKHNEHLIVKYLRQQPAAPCIKAVIFTLQDGTSMCSNPNVRWVKLKIRELDDKQRMKTTTLKAETKSMRI